MPGRWWYISEKKFEIGQNFSTKKILSVQNFKEAFLFLTYRFFKPAAAQLGRPMRPNWAAAGLYRPRPLSAQAGRADIFKFFFLKMGDVH